VIHFIYRHNSYAALIKDFAHVLHATCESGYIHVPHETGSGFVRGVDLADGLSVLIGNCSFRRDLVLNRRPADDNYYILHFDEVTADKDFDVRIDDDVQGKYHAVFSAVQLTRGAYTTDRCISANTRLRSINAMFSREWLIRYLGSESCEAELEAYLRKRNAITSFEPLDGEYRILLNEILSQDIRQPLQHIYLYNRVLLLIERFLSRFFAGVYELDKRRNLNDAQLSRLMEVEYVLASDFSNPPPNIAQLSKIAAMSPTKLKSEFKKVYGMPVYEYYQRNRMGAARLLLESRKYTVKEVGMNVGYSNLSHFASAFKRVYGVLPSELLESKN
jgi:AraC-like DNA-binding protein